MAPVKGVEGFNRASPVTGPTYVDATDGGKRLRRGARLWTRGDSTFKAETYRFLRQDRPTRGGIEPGSVSRPAQSTCRIGSDSEWLKQFDGRTAGHGAHQARLCPAGMAEAARAQRGAGLPGLCPGGRLDTRALTVGPRRGGGAGAQVGSAEAMDSGRGGAKPRHAPSRAGTGATVRSSYMGDSNGHDC